MNSADRALLMVLLLQGEKAAMHDWKSHDSAEIPSKG